MIRNLLTDIRENPHDYVILSMGGVGFIVSVAGLVWLLVFGA